MKRLNSVLTLSALTGILAAGTASISQAQTEMWLALDPASNISTGLYIVDVYASLPIRAGAYAVSASLVYDPAVYEDPTSSSTSITINSFLNLVPNSGTVQTFTESGQTLTSVTVQAGKSTTAGPVSSQLCFTIPFQTISGQLGSYASPPSISLTSAYYPDTRVNANVRSSVGYKGYTGYTASQPTTFHTDSSDPLFFTKPAKIAPITTGLVFIDSQDTPEMAGDPDTTAFFMGENLEPNAVAYWNGSPRPTYVPYGRGGYFFAVTLTAADLAQPGYNQLFILQYSSHFGLEISNTATVVVNTPTPGMGRIGLTPTLQGCVNYGDRIIYKLRPQNGGQALTYFQPAGHATLHNVPPGDYTLAIKGYQWLQKEVPVTVTADAITTVPPLTLAAGDGNNDNIVNFDDFLLLLDNYGSTITDIASGESTLPGDYNLDGLVNFDDFLLLLGNFDAQGDP